MPTITNKVFNQELQTVLSELTSGYHAGELSKKNASELPEELHVIEVGHQMVGYGVVWEYASGKQLVHKAEQDYFDDDERYLQKDFYIEMKNKKDIVFIEALDVLKEFEGSGYAAFFVDWLKEKYHNKQMYVYSLVNSRNFWYKQGFEVVGSTGWMTISHK
ncbi:GCN5 family acetyltransferase [Paenibacillus crassostreae]|uniref:GCN5 family acetyltransferase n=1 Tax=Paenibacillus crassostreae TaxID=1763538 RepID=A0A167AS53_9BACL|nr:GCN5 family acetyltransferase [Paenibacillus crassostreae]AOZ93673.1 GCN5 family acetyltransferase [Paenibacillus crassostreae]OAB71367.1 GCN5 family acetyltransferase [Paenibacillus crassostreae]